MESRVATPRPCLSLWPVALLAACVGCSRSQAPSDPAPDAAPSILTPPVDASASAPSAEIPGAEAPNVADAEVHALLERWVGAQNAGDFDAYAQLYAGKFFGIKRAGERETHYAREPWLEDRRRMFRKPIAVEVREPLIRAGTNSAQVELVQRFASGNFADEGPKRLLLVREAGTLRIAQEEMLTSRELAAVRAKPAALDFHFVLHTEHGLLLMFEGVGAPDGSGPVRLLDHTNDVWSTSQTLADDELDPALTAYRGQSVRLDDGCVAEVTGFVAVSRVDPHFGDEQAWNGIYVDPPHKPLPLARQAQLAFALAPRTVAATLRGCERAADALFGQRVATAAPVAAEPVDDAALAQKARVAFARLPDVTSAQREFLTSVEGAAGTWWEPSFKVEVFRHPGSGQLLVVASAEYVADSCADFGAKLRAFFEVRGKKLALLSTEQVSGELSRVLDVDGEGKLEILLDQVDLGTEHQLLSPHEGGPDVSFGYTYLDCPC